MAKKRAQVDATLTAVGASDILTQDLEDLRRRRDRPEVGPMPEQRQRGAELAGDRTEAPAEPPPGLTEEEMELLLTAIGGITSRAELGKFFNEKLKVESKRATGEQYKALREKFEAQQDLIDQAAAERNL
jgi:hypothetical protein